MTTQLQADGRLACFACKRLLTVEEFVRCTCSAPPPTWAELANTYLDAHGIPKAPA